MSQEAACASLSGFLSGFYRNPDLSRKTLSALKKYAPLTPAENTLIAETVKTAGYDLTAKLLLKIAGVADRQLQRAVSACFVNIFLAIFSLPENSGEFLAEDNIAGLIRRIIHDNVASSKELSRAQRQNLVICLLALYYLEHGADRMLALHSRAVMPELRGEAAAFMKSAFQPGLGLLYSRLNERLTNLESRCTRYREQLAKMNAGLEDCEARFSECCKHSEDQKNEIDRLVQRCREFEQAVAANEVDSRSGLARQRGEFASCLGSALHLLENGVSALRSGRSEAAMDHMERSVESLSAMLASLSR